MLKNLIQTGVKHSDSPISRREYYYSNLMNIGMIIIMLIALSTNLIRQFQTNWDDPAKTIVYLYLYLFLIAAGVLNLALNSWGYYTISRIIITLLLPFTIYFIPPIIKNTGVGMYLNFPYLPIGFMIVLHFLFIRKKDRRALLGIGALYFFLAIFTKDYLELFIDDQVVRNFHNTVERTWISMQVIPGVLYLFCFITIYYAFDHSRKHERGLLIAKGEIENQNEQLVELNKTKDRFHAIIAHDLIGPFNSMLGLSKLIHENIEAFTQDDLVKHANHLYSTSKNTFRLLENLLEWSRLQTAGIKLNPEKIDVTTIIHETIEDVQSMADVKQLSLQSHCQSELAVVADRNMIKTAIRNLISNAIKFTPEHGQITVSCELEREQAKVTIQDSGVGMNQALMDKLFRLDEKVSQLGTNDEKGTGLGLLLVKEFVERNGGEINVESEFGKGSAFSINLPLSK